MKRGSALLVVLGMLSFLVVSAVAFSAFMREARRPSSYLLRTSSSRLLVKAGLAEAMDAIETAIGDNVHPGVGGGDNKWIGRVFYGGSTSGSTVPTLTLEGLAYVPFPLINEVRYHSRQTPTAAWHSFRFDSGRYAYTAIDVSDYFDVNRVMAAPGGGGRTSAADGRVTLAYLFENANHTDWRTPPDEWDTFMDNFLDDSNGGSKVPLVSVADLNLAINDQKPGKVLSPWCEFIEGHSSQFMPDGEEARVQSNMVFVTDSWYPPKSGEKVFNIASGVNQPITGVSLSDESGYSSRGFEDALVNSNGRKIFNDSTRSWGDKLSPPEMAMLFDYLDIDSVPLTLALPTVERTPMVTGASLIGGLETKIEPTNEYKTPKQSGQGEVFWYEVKTYTIKITGSPILMAGLVYPFKHSRGAAKSYTVQAFATVTFVAGDADNMRPGSNSSWAMVPDWTSGADQEPQPGVFSGADNPNNCPSGFWIRSDKQTVSVPSQVNTENDAVLSDQALEFGNISDFALSSKLSTTCGNITGLQKDNCTVRIIQKMRKEVLPDGTQGAEKPVGDPVIEYGAFPAANDLNGIVPMLGDAAFFPVIQAWVRVTDPAANGQAVDLVPACYRDDKNVSEILGDEATGSRLRPALRFRDDSDGIKFKVVGRELKGGGAMDFMPKGYMTDDPRFNYAPENFIALGTMDKEFKDLWLGGQRSGASDRDGDIFMATSDAGYLQSKYEIAFLPRISRFDPNVDYGCLSGGGYNGKARGNFADCPANDAMWITYSPYEVGGRAADTEIADWPLSSGTGETAICPYTPDVNVMMGALANTPYDWWAASTNDATATKKTMLTDIKDALKYTFSERSSDASVQVKWSDMEKLAQTFINKFRSQGEEPKSWGEKYDGFAWDGALFDDLEQNSNVRLDSVDRKFLYGFWRECFDVRQQLFLIFVRAEPMMMGGGSNIRPVLGARAVALVWRDPVKPEKGGPHRMRVLFYRQLD